MKNLGPALLLVALVASPWPAHADYAPPTPYVCVKGTSVPQAGVQVYSGATTIGGYQAWNASGGTAYLMIFDATSQPSSGTGVAPVWQSASCGSNTFCSVSTIPAGGIKLTTGAWLAFSSNGPSYTQAVGASTGSYAVLRR